MAIASVIQRGTSVYAYNEKNQMLAPQFAAVHFIPVALESLAPDTLEVRMRHALGLPKIPRQLFLVVAIARPLELRFHPPGHSGEQAANLVLVAVEMLHAPPAQVRRLEHIALGGSAALFQRPEENQSLGEVSVRCAFHGCAGMAAAPEPRRPSPLR